MQYEIIKDKENLYVLIVNKIVVLISRDISRITDEIQKDARDRTINPRRVYQPAIIDVKLPKNTDKLQIIGKLPNKTVNKKDISTNKEENTKALGELFNL